MTDYTALANAIKATLGTDAWTGDANHVKSVEIHKRGFSLQELRDALYFNPADLPALAVVANAGGKEQELSATNEIRETVVSQVIAVTCHRDARAGLDAHHTLTGNVERVLDAQKSSAQDLGIDAFVQSVSTHDEQFKNGDFYFFVSTSECRIELTASI
ncbi:MAG: hypothetical protein COV67_09015 [Nitrospinae bacterium CG11_big_fil_rev_8_21_14_0_20_56_8]|nr:MAG: hypothetical protein COV67_09015 [Nitrospinae bacterium CG11_big_fil_rev_8_21_14_0_20_56_8]